jgi:putative ABC transport system substrate-binding protein
LRTEARILVNRRSFSLTCVAAVLAGGRGPAHAQGDRRPRVGYFSIGPVVDPPSPERAAFLDGLAQEGLAAGRGVEVVYASAEGNVEFAGDVARDLVARHPNVIVASGGIALQALHQSTRDVPVVILAVGDPVGLGLVTSLGRPGGNFTGSSFVSSDLAAKRVQLLHEVAPRARQMALVFDRRNHNARLESEATVVAARAAGVEPVVYGIDDDQGLTDSLGKIQASRIPALYVVFEGNIVARRRVEIGEFTVGRRLPSISGWAGLAEAGCLLSYGPDIEAMFRRGAHYVASILRGAKPGELPVEQPSRFEFAVNMTTAWAIGLKVPQNLLLRATRIIK